MFNKLKQVLGIQTRQNIHTVQRPMDQRDKLKMNTTFNGQTLAQRLQLLRQKPTYKNLTQGQKDRMKNHCERVMGISHQMPDTEVPKKITWLNTKNDEPWSFKE